MWEKLEKTAFNFRSAFSWELGLRDLSLQKISNNFSMLVGKLTRTQTLYIEGNADTVRTSSLLWRGVSSISSGVDDNLSSSLTRNGQYNVALLLVDSYTLPSYQLTCQLWVAANEAARKSFPCCCSPMCNIYYNLIASSLRAYAIVIGVYFTIAFSTNWRRRVCCNVVFYFFKFRYKCSNATGWVSETMAADSTHAILYT